VPTYLPGQPCWIDLGAPDPAAATMFYSGLFGWQIDDPDADGYRLCRVDGHLVAALGPGTDPGTPYWTNNISVADLEGTLERIVAAGGRITGGPGAAGDLGRFASATDAERAPVSLWQPGAHAGAELTGVAGTWANTELVSAQPNVARAFYKTVFDWEARRAPEALTTTWTSAGQVVATLREQPGNWPSPRPTLWTVHFAVADVDSAIEKALALGASAPDARPGTDAVVLLTDNQGALFGVRSVA
jgi:predicted enzyme related to lactoylglutathione lyase